MTTSIRHSFLALCALPLLSAGQDVVRQAPEPAQITERSATVETGRILKLYEVDDLLQAGSRAVSPPTPDAAPGATPGTTLGQTPQRSTAATSEIPGGLKALGYLGEDPAIAALRERAAAGQALSRLIRGFIAPVLVDGRDELRYLSIGLLAVNAPATAHAWIDGFFALQRQPPCLVEVKLCAFDLADGGLAKLGVGSTGRAMLHPAEAELFLGRVQAGDANVILAPRMLLFERSVGNLSALEPISYVREYRFVTVQPGNSTIADPVIETLHEGWTMEVLAARVGAGELGVDLYARQQTVQRPILEQEVDTGRGFMVSVSTPVAFTHELKTRFTVPIEVLPYAGGEQKETPAVAQVFRLSSSLKGREQAVLIQVWLREAPPVAPATQTPFEAGTGK